MGARCTTVLICPPAPGRLARAVACRFGLRHGRRGCHGRVRVRARLVAGSNDSLLHQSRNKVHLYCKRTVCIMSWNIKRHDNNEGKCAVQQGSTQEGGAAEACKIVREGWGHARSRRVQTQGPRPKPFHGLQGSANQSLPTAQTPHTGGGVATVGTGPRPPSWSADRKKILQNWPPNVRRTVTCTVRVRSN